MFLFTLASYSQSYIIRINNHLDETVTFLYNITYNANNSVNIVRTSTAAIPTDKMGLQIIGSGFSFNSNTKTISLPGLSSGYNWWGIDNNMDGTTSIAATTTGGTLTATCPCKRGSAECDVAMNSGGCLSCVEGDCTCGKIKTSNVFQYSILISATVVYFSIQ